MFFFSSQTFSLSQKSRFRPAAVRRATANICSAPAVSRCCGSAWQERCAHHSEEEAEDAEPQMRKCCTLEGSTLVSWTSLASFFFFTGICISTFDFKADLMRADRLRAQTLISVTRAHQTLRTQQTGSDPMGMVDQNACLEPSPYLGVVFLPRRRC